MTRVLAEFTDPAPVVRAIERARARGAASLETYTPYPVREIERALAAPPSRLSFAVLAAGAGGAAGAYGAQWLLNAYLYPLDVGGRPAHFPLAFVPITFEMGVLFAGLTALAAVIVGGRLLRLWHPVFEARGIESATGTSFWLEARYPADTDVEPVAAELRELGARHVEARPW